MEASKDRINDVLNSLNFSRKQPASAVRKAAYDVLSKEVSEMLKKMSRLNLGLWNGVKHRDYHSLTFDEALKQLELITMQLQDIIDRSSSK